MRFELIDRVLQREPDRLVAVKNVTSAEEYLADHFPDFAVLPGVMMLEALVQAARLLISGEDPGHPARSTKDCRAVVDPVSAVPSDSATGPASWDGSRRAGVAEPLVLAQVRNVRYGQLVRPGQCLLVEVTIRSRDDDGWEMTGIGRVEDHVAVQGRFRLALLSAPVT